MPLDEDQKQKAKAYFDEHFKCLNCGEEERYEVDLAAIALAEPKADGTMKASRNLLPVLVVGCKQCAHFQFYSSKAGAVLGGDQPT